MIVVIRITTDGKYLSDATIQAIKETVAEGLENQNVKCEVTSEIEFQ